MYRNPRIPDPFFKTPFKGIYSSGIHGTIRFLLQKCQALKEENQRLQDTVAANQMPRAQAIDNVFLQTQVSTLQWQLKQVCICQLSSSKIIPCLVSIV